VQINGKKRAELIVPATATDKEIEAAAMDNETVKRHLEGKEIRRILHIPNKTCKVLGIVVG
jgi:leucyl-tRNA synthetase